MKTQLIQCGDHKFAPWSVVCIHLIEGTSKEWTPVQVEGGTEVENDWMCPDCVSKMEAGDTDMVPLLRPICIHCVRKLRRK